MKKSIVLFFTLVYSFSSFSQENSPFITKEFPSKNINKLDINTSGGGITVSGTNNSEATVKVFIKGNGAKKNLTKNEIEGLLKNYDFSVKMEGNTLTCMARAKKDMNWNNGLSISFEANVPERISTDLKTSGGGITLDHLDGNINFKTSGGGLKLNKLAGTIDGKTSGGGIKLSNSEGKINLNTSGGGIDLADSKGEINVNTSGGGISLTNLKGNIKANTSGGGINSENINGSLNIATSGGSIHLEKISGDVEARTSGGNINAEIIKMGKVVRLSTSAGNIRANLPFNQGMDLDISGSRIKSEKLTKVSNNLKSGKVKGKVNGGGTAVKINAGMGTITID